MGKCPLPIFVTWGEFSLSLHSISCDQLHKRIFFFLLPFCIYVRIVDQVVTFMSFSHFFSSSRSGVTCDDPRRLRRLIYLWGCIVCWIYIKVRKLNRISRESKLSEQGWSVSGHKESLYSFLSISVIVHSQKYTFALRCKHTYMRMCFSWRAKIVQRSEPVKCSGCIGLKI